MSLALQKNWAPSTKEWQGFWLWFWRWAATITGRMMRRIAVHRLPRNSPSARCMQNIQAKRAVLWGKEWHAVRNIGKDTLKTSYCTVALTLIVRGCWLVSGCFDWGGGRQRKIFLGHGSYWFSSWMSETRRHNERYAAFYGCLFLLARMWPDDISEVQFVSSLGSKQLV